MHATKSFHPLRKLCFWILQRKNNRASKSFSTVYHRKIMRLTKSSSPANLTCLALGVGLERNSETNEPVEECHKIDLLHIRPESFIGLLAVKDCGRP
jgi:hypothetical protein